MKTGSDKENGAHQNGADAPDRCKGAVAGEIIQVYLVLVHYDQYPENRGARREHI